jgi:hypothetical protein
MLCLISAAEHGEIEPARHVGIHCGDACQEHRSVFIDPARLIGIVLSVLMHDRLLRLPPSKFPISDCEPRGHMRPGREVR